MAACKRQLVVGLRSTAVSRRSLAVSGRRLRSRESWVRVVSRKHAAHNSNSHIRTAVTGYCTVRLMVAERVIVPEVAFTVIA